MEDAILIVQLIAESGRSRSPDHDPWQRHVQVSDQRKTPLREFARPPIQPEQLKKLKEQCEKLQIKTRELRFFEAVPVP